MKPTLIIVDDLKATRDRLHRVLQEDFEIVEEVSNGKDAVEAARHHHPRLILMDVVMPGMSGIDAAKNILTGSPPHPVVVMLSGVREERVVMEALGAGVADYLFKPVDETQLPEILVGILRANEA